MNAHAVISANKLAVGYKNVAIATAIDFEARSGELVGIVGVNGVGKSTLLRTLAKIQRPISGSITVAEKALEAINATALATEISVVLTEPIASKNMTVEELIALGRQPYTNWIGTMSDADRSKISEVVQRLHLEDLKAKKCYELSDGQLQRVLLARALAQDTSIILLDEPTTHLDLHHKVQILKLLRTITEQTDKTILFSSHEIEMALQLCDKVIVMRPSGTAFGRPDQLIEQGVFDALFPSDTVSFDSATGRFRIKK